MELASKVVMITGGSAGLGAALALRFIEEGSAVSICGRRPDLVAATTRAIRDSQESFGSECICS